jgi:hypothetical protein
VPELLTAPLNALTRFATPPAELGSVSWAGPEARIFAARMRCRRERSCGAGRLARLALKRLVLTLRDPVSPTLALGGKLLAAGSRRGIENLSVQGSDDESGVRRFLVQVNGEPLTARTVRCALRDEVALRLRPCPGDAAASFAAVTSQPPFRQGPNALRACTADYAPDTGANRTCKTRRLRVDNLCPASPSRVTRISAHFRDGGVSRTTTSARESVVVGRLVGPSGAGVAGARACLATRVRLPGVPERVIATPVTDSTGRFRATVPAGPSREVRVAHWPDEEGALERMLRLDARARPRLRLRPRGALRNGERVRFRVELPAPVNARREVHVEVRANGRWLDLRDGRTGRTGVYRSRYRFRATTGRRSYRFRASVPQQPGYPYEAGRSAIRRKTVTG